MSAREDAVAAAAAEYGKEAGLNHTQRMVKAIAAYEAALFAAGWVMVPVEPTEAMQKAAPRAVWGDCWNELDDDAQAEAMADCAVIYRAMIAAAPEMAAALSDLIEVVDYIERTYGSRINPPTLDNARALLARIRGDAT